MSHIHFWTRVHAKPKPVSSNEKHTTFYKSKSLRPSLTKVGQPQVKGCAKRRSRQNTKKMSEVVLYLREAWMYGPLAQRCDIASIPYPPLSPHVAHLKRTQLAFSGGDLQQRSKRTVSFLPINTSKCLFAIVVSPCTEAEDNRVTIRSNTLRRMNVVRSVAIHK